jgi:hypothetical protein
METFMVCSLAVSMTIAIGSVLYATISDRPEATK